MTVKKLLDDNLNLKNGREISKFILIHSIYLDKWSYQI